MGADNFGERFKALTSHSPFLWQRRLFDEWLSQGKIPPAVDIPTGLGKTSVMVIWLLARASGAVLPRRLVYVVDRRTVVDQATEFAEKIHEKLQDRPELHAVRCGLGLDDHQELPISTLRGRHVDNRKWLADPASPAIIVGTVDMVGSRLLFSGYGVSRKMRPYTAGFMGCDTLVLLDEAHLVRPFQNLLKTIEEESCISKENDHGSASKHFAGSMTSSAMPPSFRMLPLSATLAGNSAGEKPFRLKRQEREEKSVRIRLEAKKTLIITDINQENSETLDNVIAEQAWQLAQKKTGKPVRMLVYCNSRDVADKVAEHIRKRKATGAEHKVILFVGGRRLHEREQAARQLAQHGLLAGDDVEPSAPVFLVATSAGEVGVDLDADHMVCDLVAWERMVQRLGRVNRRGAGASDVLVIDQGPPDERKSGKAAVDRQKAAVDCHRAVRELLECLPPVETGGYQAGPAALTRLGEVETSKVARASTRHLLYPALSRPLVDAWSMTSLVDHSGRPEVGPWLRGWDDDDPPQTNVIWRHGLPLRFIADDAPNKPPHVQNPYPKDQAVSEFFEAMPLQTTEQLETESYRVAKWLKKRTRQLLKMPSEKPADLLTKSKDETASALGADKIEGYDLLPTWRRDSKTPIVLVLDEAIQLVDTFNLEKIRDMDPKRLTRQLEGKRLIVNPRFGGIKEGLLDVSNDACASTIEDNWGTEITAHKIHHHEEIFALRVRAMSDENRSKLLAERADSDRRPWQEVLCHHCLVSTEGATKVWLVVEKRSGGASDEEARSMAPKPQYLDEHQRWVAQEAARIADALELPASYKKMLVAAARHHDDGKESSRWQRAFNAPKDGFYAKTAGPLNRMVLDGYRHEFQSMLDAQKNGLDGVDSDGPQFELALHLIVAHHGFSRPTIDIRSCDSLPPTVAKDQAREIALRFARLQKQWGPWGLAWWEALLRAADQSASRKFEDGKTQ